MNFRPPTRPTPPSQQGITLVEMAIVMVIAGLLLGSGILMGDSLIRGMQAKELLAMIEDLSTGTRYFKEKYHYLPGDLPLASNDITGIVAAGVCDYQTTEADVGNGLINITVIASRSLETDCLVEHLAQAGYLKGGADAFRTRFGTVRIVANSALTGATVHSNVTTLPSSILNVIEFANLPWDIAQELDRTLDDGDMATGNARWDTEVEDGEDVAFYAMPL